MKLPVQAVTDCVKRSRFERDRAHLYNLRVLCGPLHLCVEYWILKEQDRILSAKAQRTAKHAKDEEEGRP